MSELRVALDAARESFIEDLCSNGFRMLDGGRLLGQIQIAGSPVEHSILVPADFPIAKPLVSTPGGEGGLSWHRESDGTFCLWSSDEASHLPWASAAAVLQSIELWHTQSAAGWPDDPPDLDLERYWPQRSELLLHPHLGPLLGKQCKVIRMSYGYQLQPGPAPKKKDKVWGASVVDVGELTQPIRAFDQLGDRLAASEFERLRAEIEKGTLRIIVIRYSRQGHVGSLALLAKDRDPNQLFAIQAADSSDETYFLRAGFDADVLSEKRVAVVGVGAVGSFVADLLVRSGIGELTLIDPDLVRPGNCIRHLVRYDGVGKLKVSAVKDCLIGTGFIDAEDVITKGTRLTSADEIEQLFETNDLVIDATGNGPATALILTASRALHREVVTVCVQRNGTVARVDRSPLRSGESYEAPVPPGGPKSDLREGGCGEAISPTPPWVCTVAASQAVGMAADLLSKRREYPPTIIHTLAFNDARTKL